MVFEWISLQIIHFCGGGNQWGAKRIERSKEHTLGNTDLVWSPHFTDERNRDLGCSNNLPKSTQLVNTRTRARTPLHLSIPPGWVCHLTQTVLLHRIHSRWIIRSTMGVTTNAATIPGFKFLFKIFIVSAVLKSPICHKHNLLLFEQEVLSTDRSLYYYYYY